MERKVQSLIVNKMGAYTHILSHTCSTETISSSLSPKERGVVSGLGNQTLGKGAYS